MTNTNESPKQGNRCMLCLDALAIHYDSTNNDCLTCPIMPLLVCCAGSGNTDTMGRIIWITRIIAKLGEVISWCITEREYLEQISVKNFLSKWSKKGKE